MTGRLSRMCGSNIPNVEITHCVIHREHLASKKMTPELRDVLTTAIKVVVFIKVFRYKILEYFLFCNKWILTIAVFTSYRILLTELSKCACPITSTLSLIHILVNKK